MRGDARAHASGSGAAARLALVVLLAQGPAAVSVGRVTAVAWPPQQGLAVALAEAADRSPPFPGVGPLADRPIRLILAPTRARFDSLTRVLRADRTDAETAYGLATTAVLLLERWGGGGGGGRDGGLGALIDNLAREPTFDAALRATYHVTEGDFESRWQRDVAQRYGWISWAGAAGVFWAALGLVLAWLVRVRRRR